MSHSSTGQCLLCGGTFKRNVMTRHLATCTPSSALQTTAPSRAATGPSYHILVEGGQKTYWMHVAIPVNSALSTLDEFLRDAWLECCGHLSAFTIAGERYAAEPEPGEEDDMSIKLNRVLQPGLSLKYEYDYGSTTELHLKVVGVRDQGTARRGVQLLARNDPPKTICADCKSAPATLVCTQCIWDGEGWLCEPCSETHKCGDEMCLPVVNSPRVGVCGYTG
jgi:Plasmid pRiA4b ORF-3-like protein